MKETENDKNAPYGFASKPNGKIPNPTAETSPRGGKAGKKDVRAILATIQEYLDLAIQDAQEQIKGQLHISWAKGEKEARENLFFLEGRKLTLLEVRNFVRRELKP